MRRNILLLFIIFFSCKQKPAVVFSAVKDFKLNFGTHESRWVSSYINNTTDYLVYLNAPNKIIGFLNINTKHIEDSIPLLSLDSIHPIQERMNFFVQNSDSVFVILNDINKIYLLDHKGKIKKYWSIDMELANHCKEYAVMALPQIPLYFQDNIIYVMNARMDIVLRSPATRKIYFASVPDLIINIEKENFTVTNSTGKWPAIYQDYWPSRCVDDKGQIIYSFSVNDSLYIYQNNGDFKRIVKAQSKYFDTPVPYPDDSLDNFRFKRRYLVTQSRYNTIQYDPYRHWYYRIVKHAGKYENEDGTVSKTSQKPWSVIVLNEGFEIIDEVCFDPKLYTPYVFSPIKEGIIISRQFSENDGNYRSFVLFKPDIK